MLKNLRMIKNVRYFGSNSHGIDWANIELPNTDKPIIKINNPYYNIIGIHSKIEND